MTEYPDSSTIDTLRELIQLCENHKISQIKVGPVELSFLREQQPNITYQTSSGKEMEAQRAQDLVDRYAAGGVIPNYAYPNLRGDK